MIKKLRKNKLIVNSFYLMSSAAVHSLVGFLFYIIIVRLFSADDVGLSVNLLTSLSFVMVLSHFGFSESIIKFYKKSKDKKALIGTSISISAILSVFFGIIILAVICINISEIMQFFTESPFYGLLFVLMSLFWTVSFLVDSIYIAIEESKYVFFKTIIFSFFKLALPFFLVSLGFFGIYSAWAIAAFISLVLIQAVRKIRFRLGINLKIIKKIISFTFINYIGNIAYWLRNFLVPFLITLLFGAAQAAFFYVPLRLLDLMLVVPKSTGRALFAQNSAKKTRSKNTTLVFSLSIASSLFFMIMFFFFGNRILLIYGSEYMANGFAVLKILSLYGLFMALNEILLTQAQHSSDSKEILIIRVLSSFFTIVSLWHFISYGVIGFAFAFLFGEGTAFVAVILIRIRKYLDKNKEGESI